MSTPLANTGFFCPRHETVHVYSLYRAHMDSHHEGRADCVLGLDAEAMQAIIDGAPAALVVREATLTPLAREIAYSVLEALREADTAAYLERKLDLRQLAVDVAIDTIRIVRANDEREAA